MKVVDMQCHVCLNVEEHFLRKGESPKKCNNCGENDWHERVSASKLYFKPRNAFEECRRMGLDPITGLDKNGNP